MRRSRELAIFVPTTTTTTTTTDIQTNYFTPAAHARGVISCLLVVHGKDIVHAKSLEDMLVPSKHTESVIQPVIDLTVEVPAIREVNLSQIESHS